MAVRYCGGLRIGIQLVEATYQRRDHYKVTVSAKGERLHGYHNVHPLAGCTLEHRWL